MDREFGDLNCNGVVDGFGYIEVLSYWGTGVAEPHAGRRTRSVCAWFYYWQVGLAVLRRKGAQRLTYSQLSCGPLP